VVVRIGFPPVRGAKSAGNLLVETQIEATDLLPICFGLGKQ
jgi:hypothetical protein